MKRISFTFDAQYSQEMMRRFLLAINQRLDELLTTSTKSSGESVASSTVRSTIDQTIHNFAIGRGTYFELFGVGADAGLTGIAGGVDGRLIILRNIGTNTIRLFHNSNSSIVGNRIKTSTEGTIVMSITNGLILVYDGVGQVWIPTGNLL